MRNQTPCGEVGVVAMTDETRADFGDLLRRQRRAAGLTQEELAAQAGLSARGIADLERGARRTPRRDTVALLVHALRASPEDEAALLAAARHSRAPVGSSVQALSGGVDPAASDGHWQDASHSLPPNNLPAQLTLLLGRDEISHSLTAFVRRADVRLVTLTGPGGIGKTRLAMQVAVSLLGDFANGVWFVRLSRLTDPNLVIPTIAQTLGLKEMGGQAIAAALRIHLREQCLLLVLDNCEHVAAAAPDIADLLATCPTIKALTTSRAALRLRGEREYPIPPLDVPPGAPGSGAALTPERLAEYPAVALFVERARAAKPDFALTAGNAAAVAEICARLDGLPLAIELAAARVKLLPPSALLTQLQRDLGFLAGGARDLDERQQAMRGAIAWSERLLSGAEQALFRRLAAFAGGCALEAAQAVCAAPVGAEPLGADLFDGLGALVDQNLIFQREEDGEPRFGMLHVIREYALERLEASGEAEALRRAHAAYMLALAERAGPELTGPEAVAWLGRMEREHDNLRAALGWARERGEVATGLRLVASVFRFWMARGHLREGRTWVEGLLKQGEDTAAADSGEARTRALFAAGTLALYQGDKTAAETWLEQAAARGRAEGDLGTAANALSSLGVVAMQQGHLEQAGARLDESLTLARAVGERRGIAVVLTNLGIVVYLQHDLSRAADCFSEALAVARQLGDRDLIATSLANLSAVALQRGEVPKAEALGREALALYRELSDPRRCAVGLEGLASSAGMAGLGARAARLLGAAMTVREALGAPLPAHELADVEQFVAVGRTKLGEEQWALALTAGRALSLRDAIAEALDEAVERGDSRP
jgi:predicted ATPase/transcriptional regulator with XRE-family HTH domain